MQAIEWQYQYPVMETFFSIQGEGFHQGHAAFFIRLGGCDVGCVWCDVKESWNAAEHPTRDVASLVREVKESGSTLCIITGGEPLMYNCDALTHGLQAEGISTHLETSGAYPLSGNWDWICVSPKKFKAPLADVLSQAHELKTVVFHKSDLDWALLHEKACSPNCKLYLQPEWSKEKEMLPLLTDFIKQHPRYGLSLQIHKYMGVR